MLEQNQEGAPNPSPKENLSPTSFYRLNAGHVPFLMGTELTNRLPYQEDSGITLNQIIGAVLNNALDQLKPSQDYLPLVESVIQKIQQLIEKGYVFRLGEKNYYEVHMPLSYLQALFHFEQGGITKEQSIHFLAIRNQLTQMTFAYRVNFLEVAVNEIGDGELSLEELIRIKEDIAELFATQELFAGQLQSFKAISGELRRLYQDVHTPETLTDLSVTFLKDYDLTGQFITLLHGKAEVANSSLIILAKKLELEKLGINTETLMNQRAGLTDLSTKVNDLFENWNAGKTDSL